ncbi:fimbrillin family protein [Hoylesella enoeca]|uniref:fimbrillin family protein n=1 Tax=Hoylesella enoeca TaxID=76123 RepID=UPI001F3283F4|nr:fimbrillin family protein [Hoylesella enoeca]
MKKYSKYHFSALLLMLATGLASVSCADEDIAKDQENNGKSNFSFSVTDVQDAPDADLPSRATDAETYLTHSIDFNEAGTSDICLQESTVPGVNPMKRTPQTRAWLKSTIDANFGAFACKNGSAGPDFFYNEEVNRHGQMVSPISWSRSAATLKFYAVYPYMDGTNTRQKLVQATTGSLPYVEFEASTDIANQTDLMTAETATLNYTATGGSPHVVPLKFYHALTAIRFGIGSNLSWNKTIKSIEFQGIYKAGHFDLATKTWSHQSGAQTFKLDNLNQSTSGTLNTVIVKDGNTFLMVPQTLPSGAKIVITFADNSHITANIGGKTWAPGTTKTYMMTERNSSWEYKIEATDPADIAYDQTTSTTPYTIKSYRKDPATNTFQPVKWKVVSYQESADGGLTWGAETQTKLHG